MPRAFLITHRRYNGAVEEFEESGRGYSPERGVRLAEYSNGHPTSDGASECGSETSSECPEELYNLTKLAEVSLAAAAGTLIHPSNVIYERPNSPKSTHLPDKCAARVVMSRTKSLQQQQQSHQDREGSEYQATFLQEERSRDNRGKLFFERIESDRETVDGRTEATVLQVRLSSQSQHLHSRHPRHQRDDAQLRVPPEDGFVNELVPDASSSGLATPSNSTTFSANIPQTRKISSINGESGKSEDNEDHECPDCGKKYSTSSNLARHRQTHRSLGDKKARRCPHCDKVYVSMPAFSMHVRTHNQGCKCHYCGKCFSRPWLLQGHIRTHTGEKPFKCTICNKAFADKSNLRAHIQTHSNTKPHVCGRCGKAFALKSYLYKHEESACMRAHHRSPAEKNETSESSKVAPGPTPVAVASSTSRTSEAAVSPSSLSRLQATPTPCITASPTSVIVPRLDLNREQQRASTSAFSAIIRHTRTSELPSSSSNSNKRVYRDKSTFAESPSGKSADTVSADNPSKMVIRTSVISPNPEHLGRFGSDSKKSSNSYDYPESVRVSAFSRPMAMTLNLAIA